MSIYLISMSNRSVRFMLYICGCIGLSMIIFSISIYILNSSSNIILNNVDTLYILVLSIISMILFGGLYIIKSNITNKTHIWELELE